MIIHFYTCGWILIYYYKVEKGIETFEFSSDNLMVHYFESLYLMTTTISTVGYGDFKGFYSVEPYWHFEMTYLIFVTITGIILFGTVANQIFKYKTLLTVHEMVNVRVKEIEIYMYQISATLEENIPLQYIHQCKKHVELSIRNSTKFHFKENPFYQQLSPKLQTKLVKICLVKEARMFHYFFNDDIEMY